MSEYRLKLEKVESKPKGKKKKTQRAGTMKITPWKHVDLGDLTGTATMEGRSMCPSVFEEKKQNQLGSSVPPNLKN